MTGISLKKFKGDQIMELYVNTLTSKIVLLEE